MLLWSAGSSLALVLVGASGAAAAADVRHITVSQAIPTFLADGHAGVDGVKWCEQGPQISVCDGAGQVEEEQLAAGRLSAVAWRALCREIVLSRGFVGKQKYIRLQQGVHAMLAAISIAFTAKPCQLQAEPPWARPAGSSSCCCWPPRSRRRPAGGCRGEQRESSGWQHRWSRSALCLGPQGCYLASDAMLTPAATQAPPPTTKDMCL